MRDVKSRAVYCPTLQQTLTSPQRQTSPLPLRLKPTFRLLLLSYTGASHIRIHCENDILDPGLEVSFLVALH
jgi:hypothetical protein